MAFPSPLAKLLEHAETVLAPGASPEAPTPLAGAFAPVGIEYAALRTHAALFDAPHRGVLEVTGEEHMDFLNRMLTQELKDQAVGSIRRSFWLSRKGRIDADFRIIRLHDRVLLEVDLSRADAAAASLASFIIMESCEVKDVSQAWHRMSLHGPTALRAIAAASNGSFAIENEQLADVTIAGTKVTMFRDDWTGSVGLELLIPTERTQDVVRKLIEAGHDPAHATGEGVAVEHKTSPQSKIRLLPVGWHAFNIARMEAGTPLFGVDFDSENLPAESGVLHDRVSFTKGCYLGQEIVARMHARKQVKQVLTRIRVATTHDEDVNIAAGQAILASDGTQVGTVTSASPSPMLSLDVLAFGQIKSGSIEPGKALTIEGRGATELPLAQPIAGLERPTIS
jgi:folate-binding protein YgfZ